MSFANRLEAGAYAFQCAGDGIAPARGSLQSMQSPEVAVFTPIAWVVRIPRL
jgi:hypothetical protein